MADEKDEEDEKDEYVVSRWTPKEMDAAGESILEALRQHDPQAEDELAAHAGLERGLLLLAGGRLELEGRAKVIRSEAGGTMYWLTK